jgi:hypothetical protein
MCQHLRFWLPQPQSRGKDSEPAATLPLMRCRCQAEGDQQLEGPGWSEVVPSPAGIKYPRYPVAHAACERDSCGSVAALEHCLLV